MGNLEEAIELYQTAKSKIVEHEQALFKGFIKDLVEDKSFSDSICHTIGKSYPTPIEYAKYLRLRNEGEVPTYLSEHATSFLVMDNALALKPNGQIEKEDYINAVRKTFREVGFERMRLLLGIDD